MSIYKEMASLAQCEYNNFDIQYGWNSFYYFEYCDCHIEC